MINVVTLSMLIAQMKGVVNIYGKEVCFTRTHL